MDRHATDNMIALRDHLATRRTVSTRFMADPGPDDDALAAILTLAARVPDHGKLAPWRFVVFRGEARARAGAAFAKIAEARGATGEALDEERGRFTRAPVVVAVVSTAAPHPKIPEWEQQLSAGAVCMTLLNAASAHGFCAQWLTEWISYDGQARAAIGLTPEEQVAGFIHIGTPTVRPTERERPDVSALTTHF